MKIWPYHIVERSDEDIQNDLKKIIDHFESKDRTFHTIVFIPNAGFYLSEQFQQVFGDRHDIQFVTVRRNSSVRPPGKLKQFVFKRKWASNLMRHVEVFSRLMKMKMKVKHKRSSQKSIDFEITKKDILVIDDSVDTGSTLRIIKQMLLDQGAGSVTTACISNHLRPNHVEVDFAVYRYALLRTKNSRDYDAA